MIHRTYHYNREFCAKYTIKCILLLNKTTILLDRWILRPDPDPGRIIEAEIVRGRYHPILLLHWYNFSLLCLQMFFYITILWERLITLVAFIWFLPSVVPHMSDKISLKKKALSHCLHWYAFSPVCVFMWLLRWVSSEKDLPHWVHWYGCSPLCILVRLMIIL